MAQKLHKHQLTIVQDNRGKVAVIAMHSRQSLQQQGHSKTFKAKGLRPTGC